MAHIRTGTKRIFFGSVAMVVVAFSGAVPTYYAYADGADSCTPVTSSDGVQRPTGADASTYTYNACTGLWENPYYTWSPVTKEIAQKYSYVYTYNTSTGKWDAKKWVYSPASTSWYQEIFSVAQPPAGAQTVGGPAPAAPTPTSPPSTADSTAPASGTVPAASVAAPATNTSSSNNNQQTASNTDNTNNTNANTTNNTTLNNTLGSTATTGDASAFQNTLVGNVSSGNAQAIANAVNLLQSSSSMTGNVATFVKNIDGDVQGDLIIDPNALQPAQATNNLNSTNNVDINVANNGEITNNIALNATSGNATASENTTAGNVSSGNAKAVADVVNMMNSMIASSQSFLGVININGNLNGNILLPQNFLDTLLATNAPHETVSVSQSAINNVTANVSNNQAIANNITASAKSGNVDMTANTVAGNATSGSAKTNVTIFDLTNSQVVDKNTMLVFVNVVGKWVGLLMDAPAGSTAVALGGGVTNASMNNTVNANVTNNGKITNNIDASATSGNVTASKNTEVGNATSGDASAAVNVANIMNSSFSMSNWFGILFINVFGSWTGNFGVMKVSAGGTVADGGSGSGSGSSGDSGGVGQDAVFGFIPTDASSLFKAARKQGVTFYRTTRAGGDRAFPANNASTASPLMAILGSSTVASKVPATTTHGTSKNQPQNDASSTGLMAVGAGLVGFGALIWGVDHLLRRRQG